MKAGLKTVKGNKDTEIGWSRERKWGAYRSESAEYNSEREAVELHRRLSGASLGSVLDPLAP